MRHVVAACLLLATLDLGAASSAARFRRPAPPTVGLPAGTVAPAFRLMDTSGKAVAMSDFRGKVVYLDFWFTGCKPCMAEIPAAAQLKQRFRGRDVVFVYVANETNVEGWRQSVEKNGLASPNSVHLMDPEGKYAIRAYGVQGFPTYMVIGRNGRVLDGNAPRPSDGRRTVRELERALATR